MQTVRRPRSASRRGIRAWLPMLGLVMAGGGSAAPVETPVPVALAAAAGTVYAIDGPRAAIVARRIELEAASLAPPRDMVVKPADGSRPVALAVVEARLLAAVCRSGTAWTLETWTLEPGGGAKALQTLALGAAAGSDERVAVAASPTGDWLAISGLPAPLPPVVRAAIAGRRVAPPSARNCPRPDAPPAALAVSPNDALVVFETPATGGGTAVRFHDSSGRELLRLDSRLTAVRGAAFDPADGSLFVVGERREGAERSAGLWRLDAVLENGRQAVSPVLVAEFTAPRAMAIAAAGTAVVARGTDGRTLELVRTATASEKSTGGLTP